MTPRSSTIDVVALGRYLNGTAVPEDHAAVEAWIGADPVRRAAVAALQAAWAADAQRLDAPYDVDAAWARLASRLGVGRRSTRLAPVWWDWRRAAVAAALTVGVAAGGAWWLIQETRGAADVPAMREYATPRGRRAMFRLLDGTEIALNAETRLRVPVSFGTRARDVHLDGEAYFSVVHDTSRPFVVHTAGGAVRDIGTRFGVYAYGDASSERVTVAEGAVVIAAPAGLEAPEVALRAGQVATRLPSGAVRVLRGVKVSDELAWTRGRLMFVSEPLGEAARRLGRWYDLEVRVTDPELANRPITGSYSDEPVTQVLTLITAAVGARYAWRGRSVTIFAARGAP